jgi:hypothetical protein
MAILWLSLLVLTETLNLMSMPTGNPTFFLSSYLDSIFSIGNMKWYASIITIQLSIILFGFVAAYLIIRNIIIFLMDSFMHSLNKLA